MDKGAHFYSCDFQVHSPRDRQWRGERPNTDSQKKEYANEFVAACRLRGLHAVAITDHHDMYYVSIIQEAAKNERDSDGQLLSENQQLVVFPGMELTLGIPCQALILFDADLPPSVYALALTALAINQAPDDSPTTDNTERLTDIKSLKQLYELLDRYAPLKGRYIVLPNVSEGGTSTLLRSGHAGHYKEMPCVGGYVDGNIGQLGEGNTSIIAGKNSDYGNKKIAVFQTSDNRSRDFTNLGVNPTWVKWATPTAEALRQACLAQESRVSQIPPFVPPLIVTSLQVSISKFLGSIVLNLNPQYNALIGGRGTGKSTILEYLRWGLCDDPPNLVEEGEETDYKARRRSLIEKTLVAHNATVQINFLMNGVPHSVRRNSQSGDVLLKIADSEYTVTKESDIRSLFPLHSYSQKQLSQVGVKIEELNRFIRQGVSAELDESTKNFKVLSTSIRTQYGRVLQFRSLTTRIRNNETELRSSEEQVRALRAGLKGLDDKDQQLISLQYLYEEADAFLENLNDQIELSNNAISELAEINPSIATLNSEVLKELPDRELIVAIGNSATKLINDYNKHLATLRASLNSFYDETSEYGMNVKSWNTNRQSYQEKYVAAKARSTAHQTTLDKLTALETRLKTIRMETSKLINEKDSLANPDQEFTDLFTRWAEAHRTRADKLSVQCKELTQLSGGLIRATLKKCASYSEASMRLRSIFTGTNVRTSRVDSIFENVAINLDPIGEWMAILIELETLASLSKETTSTIKLPQTPKLSALGFSASELQKLANKITSDNWLDLALTPLDDKPEFEYRAREAEYIPFADASAGQQATALLWALLNQEGPPLVIDQPEDDLDNKVITQVVEQIWKAKPRRQLIFSSHNANLVVNGDAELVVCCDHRVTGDQSTGQIKHEGAIDVKDVREEITRVMEGGQDAFRLRKEKYGF